MKENQKLMKSDAEDDANETKLWFKTTEEEFCERDFPELFNKSSIEVILLCIVTFKLQSTKKLRMGDPQTVELVNVP